LSGIVIESKYTGKGTVVDILPLKDKWGKLVSNVTPYNT
jgi:hypothetical protein